MNPSRFAVQARGALCGLAAAALFGVSAPIAKLLLGEITPVLLAGLLYLGAATGLWLHRAFAKPTKEASLRRSDSATLAAIVVLGGIVGPVLMLLGLSRVSALAGSLLLNLEAPFTVLLAVVLFREYLGRHAANAIALIFAGAVVLKLEPGAMGADTLGVLMLAGACFCWGIDNNLTQRLALKDPFAIVRVKTLVAGVANTALGLTVVGGVLPAWRFIAVALVIGSLSYGVSIVLDAFALRLIGATREAAYFATAPFVGALASLLLLDEPLQISDLAAMSIMALGVILLLREEHSHEHTHEALVHEHLHWHDAHHRHEHQPDDPPGEPHSHVHRHEPITHTHPHVPDAHHRHRH
jgi:drug/metabolite transporter (DMT)-like permease